MQEHRDIQYLINLRQKQLSLTSQISSYETQFLLLIKNLDYKKKSLTVCSGTALYKAHEIHEMKL